MNDKCLNLFQDELLQLGFIFHRAVRGKEAVLDALHGVIADKFVTKRHFVDFFAVKPVRPQRITRRTFSHRHTVLSVALQLFKWSI